MAVIFPQIIKFLCPQGYFNAHKDIAFNKIVKSKIIKSLSKVDWVNRIFNGLNMKKFKKKIFDQNYFLYFEEIDLCKSIQKKRQTFILANDLKINHLGFKGSRRCFK